MHTTVIRDGAFGAGDVRIHHNSDWSGNASLVWTPSGQGPASYDIPGWVAQELCGIGARAMRKLAYDIRDLLVNRVPEFE